MTPAEAAEWEADWRTLYEWAFQPGWRFLTQCRAAHAYSLEDPGGYAIVPIHFDVPGAVDSAWTGTGQPSAYYCEGPLVDLREFSGVESFVAPHDLSWTMVYTHEDYAWGGPYFARVEWTTPPRGFRNPRNGIRWPRR